MNDGRSEFQAGPRSGANGGMSGLDLIGAVVFLGGCLPAASLAKAAMHGTDLSAEGLGGTARLAATVAGWVGLWPGLLVGIALAAVGAAMVVGGLRKEPLKLIAGVVVSGMCLAAMCSAFNLGAGGLVGDASGGALAERMGSWVGALVGGGMLLLSLVLSFAPEGDAAGGSNPVAQAASALKERARRRSTGDEDASLRNRGRRARKIQAKSQRQGDPVTLGDALARGGSEGVTHDEAAALAPDAETLSYMENVWRRASESFTQADPIPPSPYPEDVRLQGEIPSGAIPLDAAAAAAAEAKELAEERAQELPPMVVEPPRPASEIAFEVGDEGIAPFDFPDELSAPVPLAEDPAGMSGTGGSSDPFGSLEPSMELSAEAAGAFGGAAAVETPSMPEGVRPLAEPKPVPKPSSEEPGPADEGPVPTEYTSPPTPSWERGDGDHETLESASTPDLAEVAEVDPSGHWSRREDEQDSASEPEAAREAAHLEPADEAMIPLETSVEQAEVDAEEDELAELEIDGELELDPEALEVEVPVEEPEEDLVEEEALEAEDSEDDEEVELEEEEEELEEEALAEDEEYEYVDEDGNPIDPEDLEGEWEVVEEEEEEEDGEEALAEDEEWEDDEEEGDEAESEAAEWEEYEEEDAEDPEEEAEAAAEEPEAEAPEEAQETPMDAPEGDLAEAEAGDEPTVVLEPQAPPPDGERLRLAGRLVLEEGRVAVSLLQREMDLAFDEACGVLDSLQEHGLIGPYKGGKARDILLSAVEWEALFAPSSPS